MDNIEEQRIDIAISLSLEEGLGLEQGGRQFEGNTFRCDYREEYTNN